MEQTGCLVSTKDIRDYRLKINDTADLPSYFVLDSVPVKAQGSAPTCTAHVLAQIVEYHTMKECGEFHRYSTNYIYANKSDTEHEGMSYREGLDFLRNHGDVLYDECKGNYPINEAKRSLLHTDAVPAEDSKITAYYKLKGLDEVKAALMQDGVVGATMVLYDDYDLRKGVYIPDTKTECIDHAVMVIGWDETCLILQNSWGRYWGDKGRFKVQFFDMDLVFKEFYGVTDDIDTVITPSKAKKKVSKPVNAILNLLVVIVKLIAGLFNKSGRSA